MTKMVAVAVPGSVITADTAEGYLSDAVSFLFGDRYEGGFWASCDALAGIERRIAESGLMSWDEIEAAEARAMAAL